MRADFTLKNFPIARPSLLLEGNGTREHAAADIGPSALDSVMAGLSRIFRGLGDLGSMQSPRDWTRKRLSEIVGSFVPFEIAEASHFDIAINSLRAGLARRGVSEIRTEEDLDCAALGEAVERLDYLFRLEPVLNYRFVVEQHAVDVAGIAASRICDLTIIEEALRSPHPAVRGSALRALARLASASEPYMNGEKAHKAGSAVLRARGAALAAVFRLAESCDDPGELEARILPCLCGFGHSSVPYLQRLLAGNRSSAVAVIDALGRLGDVAWGSVSCLTTELSHPDLTRRIAAGRALLAIGAEWPETIEKVAKVASAPGGGALKELIEARQA